MYAVPATLCRKLLICVDGTNTVAIGRPAPRSSGLRSLAPRSSLPAPAPAPAPAPRSPHRAPRASLLAPRAPHSAPLLLRLPVNLVERDALDALAGDMFGNLPGV